MSDLRIGLALSPTWLRDQSWRRADSQVERMFSLDFFTRVATAAERGRLDFLFAPDTAQLNREALGGSPGFSTLDSLTLTAALVAVTSRVGLVPTIHTSFAAPYVAARQLMSLQHLSDGRLGWNAVTALGGHANVAATAPPERRYEVAAEFVAVVRRLWEDYPAGALTLDRDGGRFADVDRIAVTDHGGEHFSVAGPLTLPTHPAGPPPMFQAGDSPQGRDFAARHADAVFAATSGLDAARELRAELARRGAEHGRPPGSVRVLPGLSLVLAATRAEAEHLAHEIDRGQPTRGASHWSVVGTPADAVRAITGWAEAGAIDGFIALPQGWWGSIDLLVDEVVPALVDRGLFRPDDRALTLRSRL